MAFRGQTQRRRIAIGLVLSLLLFPLTAWALGTVSSIAHTSGPSADPQCGVLIALGLVLLGVGLCQRKVSGMRYSRFMSAEASEGS